MGDLYISCQKLRCMNCMLVGRFCQRHSKDGEVLEIHYRHEQIYCSEFIDQVAPKTRQNSWDQQ